MSEAIRKLPRRQREMFDRLHHEGPVLLSSFDERERRIIERLVDKNLALIVDDLAYVWWPLQPGDYGQLDRVPGRHYSKNIYLLVIRVGAGTITVRRTEGCGGTAFGPRFNVELHRFLYVGSPWRERKG